MENSDDKKRLIDLTERLSEAARAYYDEDRELMSNAEYDRLYDELVRLEAETGIKLSSSPTGRVGYTASSALVKETHASPMLSLDKTKSPRELANWLSDKEGVLSWKLDGLTVALTYSGGELSKAVTRGDGQVGEVITENAKTFINLPLKIPYDGELLVRGEAVISYADFEMINSRIEEADAKYKNPRNLASGSVRQIDPAVTAERCVGLYAFALVSAEPWPDDDLRGSASARMKWLSELGFSVVPYEIIRAGDTERVVERFAAAAPEYELPSDGLVLTYEDIEYGMSLGRTAKFPRDSIAFKWQDELVSSHMLDIEWSASRTGLINPIAIFEPVEIEGTTVSRASLHNVSIMEELALGKGDEVLVYKANMIIPQIDKNLTMSGTFTPPELCPVCGSETVIEGDDLVKTLRCNNPKCPAKLIGAFTHFVSKGAVDIDGLSESSLEKLISAGFVKEYADLFKLDNYRQEIVCTEGFGEKSFGNLQSSIKKASELNPAALLYALGIPGVGKTMASLIMRSFKGDWQSMCEADAYVLGAIDGVGPVIAQSIVCWFADEYNRRIVSDILEVTRFANPAASDMGDALAGKTFVITGALTGYKSRDELTEKIESLGGRVSSSVSAKTDYLINNDARSGSSKNVKAAQLGVAVITEAEFEALI